MSRHVTPVLTTAERHQLVDIALIAATPTGREHVRESIDYALLSAAFWFDRETLERLQLDLLDKIIADLEFTATTRPQEYTRDGFRRRADEVREIADAKRVGVERAMALAPFTAIRSLLIAALLLFAGAAHAAEHWQVDQPQSWYRFDVSHHGKHAAGGAVVGAASYVAVRAADGDRGDAIAVGVVDGFLAGAAYELVEGRDGRSWVDPIDALWTTAGAAVGAVTAAITDRAIGAAIAVIPRQDGVAVAWAKKF